MAVCLHCLHAERLAARDRRQRTVVRLIAWTLSLTIIAVVGAAGVSAATKHPEPSTPMRMQRRPAPSPAVTARDTVASMPAQTVQLQGTPSTPMTAQSDSPLVVAAAPVASATVAKATVATVAAPAVPDSAAKATPLLGPIIPQGRTDFQDSMYAVRRGDAVVVNFDTGPSRTRRADKFELIVRQTLHAVYGPVADTVLSTIPSGKLASASELVTTLPKRGIHLQGAHGPHLGLWPETRAGRNGPLVVAYRTIVER